MPDQKLAERLPAERSGKVGGGPAAHGFGYPAVPEVIGKHDDRQLGGHLTYAAQRLESIAVLEIEAEQDKVRVLGLELLDRFAHARRLERLVAERFDQARGRLAMRRVAVDDQNRARGDHLRLAPQPAPDFFAHLCNGRHPVRTIPRWYAWWT